jgi:hypothetical protein
MKANFKEGGGPGPGGTGGPSASASQTTVNSAAGTESG